MKIAIVSTVPGSPWAGSEELWYQTSLKCLAEGHEVMASLFEVDAKCTQLDNFVEKGGKIVFRKKFKNGRIHVIKHKFISAFNKLFDWAPDAIILSLGNLTNLALYPDLSRHIEKNTHAKVIIISLFNSDSGSLDAGSRKMLNSFCKKTDHFVFVSHHNYLLTERQLALKLKNVSIFSSPVSYMDTYQQTAWPQNNAVFTMACVARLDTHHKGHDVLLESLSGPKWKSRAWKLEIYGNGPDKSYIEELIAMYGLADKVTFGGFVTDTREIWKKNQVLVMASRAEGLSLAVLEAMICGRICVVTDVGGHGEVIEDSVSGFLAEASMPKYFEAALERAWNMQPQFEQIALEAHLSAQKVFNEKPIDKLSEIVVSKKSN